MPIHRRDVLSLLPLAGLGALGPGLARPAAGRPRDDDRTAAPRSVIRRRIPRTGELVPVIGLGTSRTFDVDPATGDLAPLEAVFRAFLAAGGTVVDSSPMYGHAESVVGALVRRSGRDDLFFATKVWTDEGRDAGVAQMEQSIERMAAPVMDLMQVHNLVGLAEHLPTLRDWKQQGRIRYLGVTEMRDFDTVERLMRNESLDFIQIPYSIGDRRVEERVLPAALDTGTAVLVMRPFERGKLFRRVVDRPLPEWAVQIECTTWAQVFLKFVLGHPAVTCPIPATSKVTHMIDNMGGGCGPMPDADLRKRMVAALEG